MPYANNKGADQPAHLRSLISTFVVRCLDNIISLVSIFAISCLWLASVAEQTGLSLTWSKTSKTGFLRMWLILLSYRCPIYNNLPSNQCYLVKAQGQCCSQPMCYDPSVGKAVNPLTSNSVFPVVGTFSGGFTGFRPGYPYSGSGTSGGSSKHLFV